MDVTRRQWALASMAAATSCDSGGDSAPFAVSPDGSGEAPGRHVIDLHCVTPMLLRDGSYDLGARNTRGEVDIPRMRDGGVTGVFFSVYTSATRNTELESVQEALEIIDAVRREVSRFSGDLALATASAAPSRGKPRAAKMIVKFTKLAAGTDATASADSMAVTISIPYSSAPSVTPYTWAMNKTEIAW